MRKIVVVFLTIVIWTGWLIASGQAQMSSTNFRIPTQALSSSGGAGNSTNFKQPVSIGGQSTPIGTATSTNFDNFAGYLYTLGGGACALLGDLTGDLVVDIVDIVAMVNNVVFGDPIPTGAICADIAPIPLDGVIDITDIICLINNVVFSNPLPCP